MTRTERLACRRERAQTLQNILATTVIFALIATVLTYHGLVQALEDELTQSKEAFTAAYRAQHEPSIDGDVYYEVGVQGSLETEAGTVIFDSERNEEANPELRVWVSVPGSEDHRVELRVDGEWQTLPGLPGYEFRIPPGKGWTYSEVEDGVIVATHYLFTIEWREITSSPDPVSPPLRTELVIAAR